MGFVAQQYDKFYRSLNFERSGLFKAVRDVISPETVLYPGCAIHVTPSFVFPHVVFLDGSEIALRFFSKVDEVTELINAKKDYRKPAYWKFVHARFEEPHGLGTHPFSLLISIFSGAHIQYFERYLVRGSYVLAADEFSGNEVVDKIPRYEKVMTIVAHNNVYKIEGAKPVKRSRMVSGGATFVDNAVYSLYCLRDSPR